MSFTEQISHRLTASFPIDSGDGTVSVQYVGDEGLIDKDGNLLATLRVIHWQVDGEERTVAAIQEQPVHLVTRHAHRDPERAERYVRGWIGALWLALAWAENASQKVYMPAELAFPDVLDLSTPRTEADFASFMLRRSRLGRFCG